MLVANTNDCYSSIYTYMQQGDAGEHFSGSKFRMLRLRVMYDFSQITITSAVRMSVVIPKDPSTAPVLASAVNGWDTQQYTVLFDRIVGDAAELLAGTFDVTGPITLEGTNDGITPLRNNVHVYFHSSGNGGAMGIKASIAVWFTDA